MASFSSSSSSVTATPAAAAAESLKQKPRKEEKDDNSAPASHSSASDSDDDNNDEAASASAVPVAAAAAAAPESPSYPSTLARAASAKSPVQSPSGKQQTPVPIKDKTIVKEKHGKKNNTSAKSLASLATAAAVVVPVVAPEKPPSRPAERIRRLRSNSSLMVNPAAMQQLLDFNPSLPQPNGWARSNVLRLDALWRHANAGHAVERDLCKVCKDEHVHVCRCGRQQFFARISSEFEFDKEKALYQFVEGVHSDL